MNRRIQTSSIPAWYDAAFLRRSGAGSWLPKMFWRPLSRPKIFQALTLRPACQQASIRAWRSTMWRGPLSRDTKEAIAVAVSAANQCHY